jgi:hypothetical protein
MVLIEVVNDDVRNVIASNDEFHICGGAMQDTGLKGGSQEQKSDCWCGVSLIVLFERMTKPLPPLSLTVSKHQLLSSFMTPLVDELAWLNDRDMLVSVDQSHFHPLPSQKTWVRVRSRSFYCSNRLK